MSTKRGLWSKLKRTRICMDGDAGMVNSPLDLLFTLLAWVVGAGMGYLAWLLLLPQGEVSKFNDASPATFMLIPIWIATVATMIVERSRARSISDCCVASLGAYMLCYGRLLGVSDPWSDPFLFCLFVILGPVTMPTVYLGVWLGRMLNEWIWRRSARKRIHD